MPTSRLMHLRHTNAIKSDQQNFDDRPAGISSVHFLKMIEDGAEFGFWTKDFDTNEGTCSAGIYRILSVSLTERVRHIDFMAMMHPDDLQTVDEFEAVMREGQSVDVDYRIIRPDGTVRWVNDRADVLFNVNGKPVKAVGVLRDVTDLHDLRQTMMRMRTRNNLLMDVAGAIEWGLYASGSISRQQSWSALTGQNHADAAHWGWLEMLAPEHREMARSRWIGAIATRSSATMDVRLRCHRGQSEPHRISAVATSNQHDPFAEWTGYVLPLSRFTEEPTNLPLVAFRGAHIRAGRALLDWTHDNLASAARISISSVRRIEASDGKGIRDATLRAIVDALSSHGVAFGQSNEGKISVSLK